MILVPNLLQQLNGSKLCLLLFLVVATCCFTSCDPLKKAKKTDTADAGDLDEIKGRIKYNPRTGKYEYDTDVKEPIDTVRWSPPVNPTPPIESDESHYGTADPVEEVPDIIEPETEEFEGGLLSTYRVAMILPFLTDKFDSYNFSLPKKSKKAINFYAGAKLALDILSREGVTMDVSVIDSKASGEEVKRVINRSDVLNANVIVGSMKKSTLLPLLDFSKKNKKILVSPTYPSLNITKEHPYFIQFSPSIKTHCEAITKHARKEYEPEEIVLVARNKSSEKNRLKYFQAANNAINGTSSGEQLKEFIVTSMSGDYNDIDVMPYINQGGTTVFLIPSFSSESFVYSFLRQVSIAKGANKVVIYGMPQWMDYKRISYDYYDQLNVHVSSASYIDAKSSEAQFFKRTYFDRYGTIPSNDAFIGYDLMLYIGRLLQKHGTAFPTKIDAEQEKYMHTKFEFEPIVKARTTGNEDFSNIDQYENKYVNILCFKEFRFQLAE